MSRTGKDLNEVSIPTPINNLFLISRPILDAIEKDLLEKLPPVVYLKNFLRSYAQILQIDPDKVSEGYIKNMSLMCERNDSSPSSS